MKRYVILLIACMIPFIAVAESGQPSSGFGFALKSGLSGEVYPLRLIPTGLYYSGNSQFELGIGFHPFIRQDQQILSGEINYKYFPNGMDNIFNMYFMGSLEYINNTRDTYYPTTYHYLFLNGGYGFQFGFFQDLYFGTNISLGGFTHSKFSENPASTYLDSETLFKDCGMNVAFQFNIGYRL